MQKWAFISGATAGIGHATALVLAAEGYNLIINGRRSDRLDQLATQLKSKHKIEVLTALFDVSNFSAVESFFKQNSKVTEQVQVLVNCAGLAKGVDKLQTSQISDWDQMIDTNVKGLLYLTRQVLPSMIKNNQGHIVNIGSVAGRWTYPNGAVYAATKFAVRALSEGLRMDLLGTSIRVTNIEPGMVETEFSLVRLGSQEKSNLVYQGMKPLTAEDIAECILWSLNRPKHVNIQELVIFPTDQAAVGQVFRRALDEKDSRS